MSNFSNLLKNLFFFAIILQFAPGIINNLKKQYGKYFSSKSQVALLKINDKLTSSTYYVKILKKFFQNSDIKAILLKIDSPGGYTGTSQAIFHEILELKKEFPKPIIVLIENICASGGYYIACAADHIISTPGATIGSIGAYFPFMFKLNDLIEKHQIHYNVIKAGEYKTIGDPFTESTSKQNTLLQSVADDVYKQFTEDVARNRQKLSLNKSEEWAEGKIFTGRQALQIGMIDSIGSITTAIRIIKEKALIEGDIEWITSPRKKGLLQLFQEPDYDEDNPNIYSQLVGTIYSFLVKNNLKTF